MPRMPLSRRLAAPDAAECTICCLGAGRVPLWRCPDAPDAAECTIRRPRAADRRDVSWQTPGCAGTEATLLKRRSYIRRDVGQREAVFPSRRIRIVQSAQSGAPAACARPRAACPCEKREALRPHEQRVRARSARGTAAAPTPAHKKRPVANPSATGRCAFWRRRRDSNSRDGRAAQRFSRPPHSTALPLLRVPNREAVTRRSPAILAYVRLSKTRERRACRPCPRPKSEGPRAPVQEAR